MSARLFDASTIIGLELVGGRTTSARLMGGTDVLTDAPTSGNVGELLGG